MLIHLVSLLSASRIADLIRCGCGKWQPSLCIKQNHRRWFVSDNATLNPPDCGLELETNVAEERVLTYGKYT